MQHAKLLSLFTLFMCLNLLSSSAIAYEVDFTSFGNQEFDNPWRPTPTTPFVLYAYTNIPVQDSLLPLQPGDKTAGKIWTTNQGAGVDGGKGGNAISAKPNNNGPQEIDIAFDKAIDLTNTIVEVGLRIMNKASGFIMPPVYLDTDLGYNTQRFQGESI